MERGVQSFGIDFWSKVTTPGPRRWEQTKGVEASCNCAASLAQGLMRSDQQGAAVLEWSYHGIWSYDLPYYVLCHCDACEYKLE